jgi:hypothetical protein
MTEMATTVALPPPQISKDIVDRNDLDWPSWLMPSAPAALVASDELVRQATVNDPLTGRPRRWHYRVIQGKGSEWFRYEPNHTLTVSRIGRWWFIRRVICSNPRRLKLQSLAFVFGPAPLCADNLKAAKRLAEYYHFVPVEAAGGLVWTDTPRRKK